MSDKLARRQKSFPASGGSFYNARPVMITPLEERRVFSVGLDSAGWTVVAPASDTRIIYVSSSGGDDANSGLSASKSVRSLGRAQSLVRDGSADWMLLKRGDSFDAIGDWKKRGRSSSEPILIGAYGEGNRPKILSGTRPGFTTLRRDGRSIDNIVITSLDFFAHTYNHTNGDGATAGIRLTSPGRNITIEDVRVAGYKDNIVLDPVGGTLSAIKIRRSQIVDAHAANGVGNGHAQGIYIGPGSSNVLIEGNVLDHNGWRHGKSSDRTYYNHNIYSQTGASGVVIRGNIISRAGFYGVKFNSGGTIKGNFFIRNSESIYLENGALIEDNVITESVDHPNQNWGVGINTQKSGSATIRGNLITNSLSNEGGPKAAISLFDNNATFRGVVEFNTVYDWPTGIYVDTDGDGRASVVIRRNNFTAIGAAADHRSEAAASTFAYAQNTYSAETTTKANKLDGASARLDDWMDATGESSAKYAEMDYPDPSRNIGRYSAGIGLGGNFDAFISAARANNHANFRGNLSAEAVNGWYRRGFDIGESPAPAPAPGIQSFSIDRGRAPHAIYVRFTANVRPSLSKNDLRIINMATGEQVPLQSMTWSAENHRARFNVRVGDLPDGKYRATIHAGAVANTDGVPLADSRGFKFHIMRGDANLDGRLTSADSLIVARNFNRAGTFAKGDFNFDGRVGVRDFALLAGLFNQSPIADELA